MFFMIGITQGRKDLSHDQLVICGRCGQYGRYQVFMTFTQLLLFFIPCFRWGKQYFVRMSCCGTVYALDPEVGARIARGEQVEIRMSDLTPADGTGAWTQAGFGARESGSVGNTQRESGKTEGLHGGFARIRKRCAACGYETEEDFDFCPKCGKPLT